MATTRAKALRRATAQTRIDKAVTALTRLFDIELPDAGAPVRDVELKAIVELEQSATLLEQLHSAIALSDLPERHAAAMAALIDVDLDKAYAAYDSDPRVNGPDDFSAFQESILSAFGFTTEAPEGQEQVDESGPENPEEPDVDSTTEPETEGESESEPEAPAETPAEPTPEPPKRSRSKAK